MNLIIIFITTLFASVLSSMSGGGTAIITFPVFLAIGIPIPLALTMGSVNGMFWVLPASRNYLKGRKIDWEFLILFALIGLIGAYFSIKVIIGINQRIFEFIIGLLIIFLVGYTYTKKDLGLTEQKIYSKKRQALAYPFALLLGFYENLFGAGNAIAFSLVSFYTRGFDFIDALGHYYAVSFAWLVLGVGLLISKGYYNFNYMAAGVVGSVIGAYIGSSYSKYKGNKFIKTVFVIIGGILGLKLLLGL
jgi:uncharacterized membrane protein YfcA